MQKSLFERFAAGHYFRTGYFAIGWVLLCGGVLIAQNKPSSPTDTYNALLQKYVSPRGGVNYAAWAQHKGDRASLRGYIAALEQNPPARGSHTNVHLAHYLNLYNAVTLDLVLTHYPVRSIKEINADKPWDLPVVAIEGAERSLNYLEHTLIRKRYPDPRVHFALVCAAKSCPRLRNTAYRSANLDKQLDNQARIFLNNPDKNNLPEGKLSVLFSWFSADFLRQSPNISTYVRRYTNQEVGATITYLPYDWSLNSF